jgi:hypothetical protein
LFRHEIKNLDRIVDGLMKEQKFHEAVQQLKRADILLNGPLSMIEGLAQLRTKILDLSQVKFKNYSFLNYFTLSGHSPKNYRELAAVANYRGIRQTGTYQLLLTGSY